MKISFEKAEHNSGVITATVEKADYAPKVAEELKKIRQKASLPGFRPGKVPASLIEKRFGKEVLAEKVDSIIGEELTKYVREQKLNVLGMPLMRENINEDKNAFWAQEEFTFDFDVALAPEMDATISSADTLNYYQVEVTDKMLDTIEESLATTYSDREEVEEYAEGDELHGHLGQLDAEGNLMEDGLKAENAQVRSDLFTDGEEAAKFAGAKVGDVLVFNPAKAFKGHQLFLRSLLQLDDYDGDIEEDPKITGANFSFQITRITRRPKTIDSQALFDQFLGEGVATNREEFRNAVRQREVEKFEANSLLKALMDLKAHLLNRIGELDYPEEMLKRILRNGDPNMSDESLEASYAASIKQLTWDACRMQLTEKFGVKVEHEDIEAAARTYAYIQFQGYGLGFPPANMMNQYAQKMLQERDSVEKFYNMAADQKIVKAVLEEATVNRQTVTEKEFNNICNPQNETAEADGEEG